MEVYQTKVIARIRTDLPEKFGLPRQGCLIPELQGKIVFEPEFRSRDAVRGLEGYSHLW
ncbi:MAG: SAM-dependent methyltransferase, partial [Oscillospiraceae bacterium]|nr:SAM-dependent methyltransferase [Oscillospiraceae bacterium]